MSERFTLEDRGYDGFDIYDSTGEYKESELFIGMSLQQIVDCLNKLNDENDEYAKIIEQSKRYEDGLWVRFTKLEKENEQLKEKLQSVTMLKDDYKELIESFEKKYEKNIEDVIDDE